MELTPSAKYAQFARRKQMVIRWGARPHQQAYPAHLRVLVASKFFHNPPLKIKRGKESYEAEN